MFSRIFYVKFNGFVVLFRPIFALGLHIVNFSSCQNYWGGGQNDVCPPPPIFSLGGDCPPPPQDRQLWVQIKKIKILLGAINTFFIASQKKTIKICFHSQNYPFKLIGILISLLHEILIFSKRFSTPDF